MFEKREQGSGMGRARRRAEIRLKIENVLIPPLMRAV